jgi:FtsZ-interacting cell division protein ZipA
MRPQTSIADLIVSALLVAGILVGCAIIVTVAWRDSRKKRRWKRRPPLRHAAISRKQRLRLPWDKYREASLAALQRHSQAKARFQEAYDRAEARAQRRCDRAQSLAARRCARAEARAREVYERTLDWSTYMQAIDIAQTVSQRAEARAEKALEEAKTKAWKAYARVEARALEVYKQAMERARQAYEEDYASL